jgi:hypothetical protein
MKRSLLFGLFCQPVGIITIIFLLKIVKLDESFSNELSWIGTFSVAIATFIASSSLWYLIIERKKLFSISRGVVVGVLSAALSHFLSWNSFLVISSMDFFVFGPIENWDAFHGVDPLAGFLMSFLYSFFSLMLFGLFHLPIFGLIGGICAKKFQNEFYSVLYNDIRTTHL